MMLLPWWRVCSRGSGCFVRTSHFETTQPRGFRRVQRLAQE